jgi:hypothetical protein
MLVHKELRALLLTFILLSGSLLIVFPSPIAQAENTQGYTTLYFTNALNIESEEGVALLTQTPPTSQKDSEYPPSILSKNGIFDKNTSILSEDWTTWLIYAAMGTLLDDLSDTDLGEFGGFEGFKIYFPGLYHFSNEYTYEGYDTVHIRGDILYNLYFSDTNKIKSRTDSVNVALYTLKVDSMFPLPRLIKNTTVLLTPPNYLGGVYNQQITLPDVNFSLSPGDSLFVSIEIVPTNKSTFVLDFLNLPFIKNAVQLLVNRWQNFTWGRPLRRQIGAAIKNFTTLLEETGEDSDFNFSSDDIALLINAMKSSKVIYNSQQHPSSVIIPAKISEEDIRIYYLHSDQKMSETQQEGTNTSTPMKLTTTPIIWTTEQGLERNKILKLQNVTAELYFYRFLYIIPRQISITVTLFEDNTTIASVEKQLTKNEVQSLFSKKITPVIFNFTGIDKELTYDRNIGIGISLSNGTKTGIIPVKLYYGSMKYPSLLRLKFEETKNIQIHDLITTPEDGKIIPGGSVRYLFNVTSLKADTLQIKTIERGKTGEWIITTPTSVTISANSQVSIPVFVNSSNVLKEAYGSSIDLIVVVSGNTGIARQSILAQISQDAIEYKVEILGYSDSINVSKGENRSFYFIIKNNNTGAIDDVDSYIVTATSKNNWPLTPRENIRNVGIGQTTAANDARVVIQVPKNTTLSSDTIAITVTSVGNPSTTATITVTVRVIPANFLESIYDIFDSAARSLGLSEMFGAYGAIVLVILIAIIVLFFLIILALLLTLKPVHLICTDRIKEIEPTEHAIYELTLKNPSKKTQSFEIEAAQTTPSSKWRITTEPIKTVIEGRESKTVQIILTPTEKAESKDWIQVPVSVKKTGKKKAESLTLLAMIKQGKTLLQIHNVSHGPTEFYPGEKVITSFSVSNTGTITARNMKVFFYLNGKQKNMVEVTIPPGNIADIQMPWIAEKGKNKVRIRIKEQ